MDLILLVENMPQGIAQRLESEMMWPRGLFLNDPLITLTMYIIDHTFTFDKQFCSTCTLPTYLLIKSSLSPKQSIHFLSFFIFLLSLLILMVGEVILYNLQLHPRYVA